MGRHDLSRALVAGAIVIVLLCGNLRYQQRYLQASDDYLWLADSAFQVFESDDARAMHDRYVGALAHGGVPEVGIARAVARRDLGANYLFQSAAFYGLFTAFGSRGPDPDELASVLRDVMFWGFLTTFVIVVAGVVGYLLRRPVAVGAAVLAALLVLFLTDSVPLGNRAFRYFPDQQTGIASGLYNLGADMVQPAPAFSPFSNTPRDRLTLLVLMVFLLRWSGAFRASSLLLSLTFFVHAEYAGLLALTILGIDLFDRATPRPRRSWLAPALVFAASAAGSPLIRAAFAGWPAWLLLLATAGGAGIVYVLARKQVQIRRLCHRIAPLDALTQRLARHSPEGRDLTRFLFLWLTTLPIAWLASVVTSDGLSDRLRLWELVHSRVWGAMHLALLTGGIIIVARRLDRSWRRPTAVMIGAGLLLASVVTVRSAAAKGWPYFTLHDSLIEAQRDLLRPLDPQGWRTEESRVYMAMIAAELKLPHYLDAILGAGSTRSHLPVGNTR